MLNSESKNALLAIGVNASTVQRFAALEALTDAMVEAEIREWRSGKPKGVGILVVALENAPGRAAAMGTSAPRAETDRRRITIAQRAKAPLPTHLAQAEPAGMEGMPGIRLCYLAIITDTGQRDREGKRLNADDGYWIADPYIRDQCDKSGLYDAQQIHAGWQTAQWRADCQNWRLGLDHAPLASIHERAGWPAERVAA